MLVPRVGLVDRSVREGLYVIILWRDEVEQTHAAVAVDRLLRTVAQTANRIYGKT